MENDKTIYSPAVIGVYVLILSVMPMPRISGKEQAIQSYAENTGLVMCTAGREGRQKGARGALQEVRLEKKNMAGFLKE